jgi:hypothetical protein
VRRITGRNIIHTVKEAEPLGPASPLSALIIAPCTGNTLAKLANGITDTAVTMAAKAHLRQDRPLLIAVASNDAMSANLSNLGALLCRRAISFVPMRQDDPIKRPHSLVADFSLIEEASQNGYTLMTHLYSGMKGVTRKNAYRIAGAVEAGLYFDHIFVEIIADGKHLPPELLKFIYKIKGADRICLITDASRACGFPEGATSKIGSLLRGTDIIVEDGVAKLPDRTAFGGSVATFDRLVRTMADAIGDDPVSLSRMASTTPASVMGFDDRGEISEGKKADLVITDKKYNVKKVISSGELVK